MDAAERAKRHNFLLRRPLSRFGPVWHADCQGSITQFRCREDAAVDLTTWLPPLLLLLLLGLVAVGLMFLFTEACDKV